MLRRSLLLAILPLALAACGGDSPTTTYPIVPIESTVFAPSLGVNIAASTKTASGLYYRDIRIGTGTTIANGQALTVRYTGSLANGQVFDAGTFGPFTIPGSVIQGWNEGLLGMKVGGSRQLIIPASLAYGATGSGPIPPNAVIVFTVEPI